jgi:hypothetical protein
LVAGEEKKPEDGILRFRKYKHLEISNLKEIKAKR